MRVLLFISLCFLAFSSNAQQDSVDHNFILITDPKLDFLVEKHTKINEERKTRPGFRVQVAISSDRKEILEKKADCIKEFDEIAPVYITYQQPYFKLRIGDFRTKLEAQKFRQDLIIDYPDALVVKDDISIESN